KPLDGRDDGVQSVLDDGRVLVRLLQLVGRVDLDGKGQCFLRRPVDAIGLSTACAAGGLLTLQGTGYFVRVVLKHDDRRCRIRQPIGHKTSLQKSWTAWEIRSHSRTQPDK